MPPRTPPRSVAEQADEEIKTEITDLVSQIAAEEGPAPHAQYVSDEHEVAMWGQQDPSVDHETLVQQLMQGAVPPERVDPSGDHPLALIKSHPELAQLFSQPLDQEMATMVATLAEYPFRLALLAPYTDDPEASVKKADSLTQRWRRRLPAREPVIQPLSQTVEAPAPSPAPPAAPLGVQESLGAPTLPSEPPPPLPPPTAPPAAPAGLLGAVPPLPRPGGVRA
jgi:hypothetical protein